MKLRSAVVPVVIAERARFLKLYNSECNRYGELVAVLVATKAIATGVTLRNTHCQIFSSEPDDILEHQQMLGRIIRASKEPMVGGFYPPDPPEDGDEGDGKTCSSRLRPVVHCFGVRVKEAKTSPLADKIARINTYAVALINSAKNVKSLVDAKSLQNGASTVVMWDSKDAALGDDQIIDAGAPALTLRLPRLRVAIFEPPKKGQTEPLLKVPMKNIAGASGAYGERGGGSFTLLEEEEGYALAPSDAVFATVFNNRGTKMAVRVLAVKRDKDAGNPVTERLHGGCNNPKLSTALATLNIKVEKIDEYDIFAIEVLGVVSANVHNFKIRDDIRQPNPSPTLTQILKTATGSLVIWFSTPLSEHTHTHTHTLLVVVHPIFGTQCLLPLLFLRSVGRAPRRLLGDGLQSSPTLLIEPLLGAALLSLRLLLVSNALFPLVLYPFLGSEHGLVGVKERGRVETGGDAAGDRGVTHASTQPVTVRFAFLKNFFLSIQYNVLL